MKIENGVQIIEVNNGISNLPELRVYLQSTLEKYENVIWTEETREGVMQIVTELKPERTEIKKVAAAFKKIATSAVDEKYREIKELETLYDKIINPLEAGEKEFLEQQRLAKFNRKKALFTQAITDLNIVLQILNDEIGYTMFEDVIFLDDWAVKSDKTIDEILLKKLEDAKKVKNDIFDKLEGIDTVCQLLKAQYDLKRTLDFKLILDEKRYTLSLTECKKILEKFAEAQKNSEIAAEEQEREIAERKAKFDIEKSEKERKEIRNKRSDELKPYIIFIRNYSELIEMLEEDYKKELAEVKKGAELQWEYERECKINANKLESERLAKEATEKRADSEKIERAKKEMEMLLKEQEKARLKAEQDKRAEIAAIEKAKEGKKYPINFCIECTKEQYNAIKTFLADNEIEYKVVK